MSRSRLSEQQRNRVRQALEAYRQRLSRGGRAGTWRDVDDAILRSTGLDVSHDTLRQWVLGYHDKNARHRTRWPKDPEDERALIEFVFAEGLLKPHELEGRHPPAEAALRLLDHLDLSADTVRIPPPPGLEGVYRSEPVRDDEKGRIAVTELTLDRPDKHGVIRVSAFTEFFEDDDEDDGFRDLPTDPAARAVAQEGQIPFHGWGILTPEDTLLFFLKRTRGGANRYYITLASDMSHDPAIPTTRLVLLALDYPAELADDPQGPGYETGRRHCHEHLRVFTRHTPLDAR